MSRGTCRRGADCTFAHGVSELRAIDEDVQCRTMKFNMKPDVGAMPDTLDRWALCFMIFFVGCVRISKRERGSGKERGERDTERERERDRESERERERESASASP